MCELRFGLPSSWAGLGCTHILFTPACLPHSRSAPPKAGCTLPSPATPASSLHLASLQSWSQCGCPLCALPGPQRGCCLGNRPACVQASSRPSLLSPLELGEPECWPSPAVGPVPCLPGSGSAWPGSGRAHLEVPPDFAHYFPLTSHQGGIAKSVVLSTLFI